MSDTPVGVPIAMEKNPSPNDHQGRSEDPTPRGNPTGIRTHRIEGSAPTPLAHYLKALGVLRVIAEQRDPNVRGWWHDDRFHLSTQLERDQIDEFFLRHYAPTPLLAPWNGGSGFYPKDNQVAIKAITESQAERFRGYRDAIVTSRRLIATLKEKPSKGAEKNGVINACRKAWRGPALQWLDAALALDFQGEPAFPAMLGTGGNDGRLDFTINFMNHVVALFDCEAADGAARADAAESLVAALWEPLSDQLEHSSIGQFFPSAAGGPNGGSGWEGGIGINSWDFLLMLEGAVLFTAGLSRRCRSQSLPQASAPFAVRSSGCGHSSSETSETGPRGEQWVPLWSQPASYHELRYLLREGKCEINGRHPARGIEMARAVARMGVARGISAFERYGYIERNGLSNLAVPLGRFAVTPRGHQRLLDEVAPWIDRLRQLATNKLAPNALALAYRGCEQAVFNCARRGQGGDFLRLLVAMGRAEDQLLTSPKFSAEQSATPIPPMSAAWLPVVAQDTSEFRLALAIAAQHGPLTSKTDGGGAPWVPIRFHWLPYQPRTNRFLSGEGGIQAGPEQAARGLTLENALIAVMQRRLLSFNRGGFIRPRIANRPDDHKLLPLRPVSSRLACVWPDVSAFLAGAIDDAETLAIARGLMAIDWRSAGEFDPPRSSLTIHGVGSAIFAGLRLALPVFPARRTSLDGRSRHEVPVRCDTTLLERLVAGDVTAAYQTAMRRLTVAGLRPRMTVATGSPALARRLAAAMAIPLRPTTLDRLVASVIDPDDDSPDDHRGADDHSDSAPETDVTAPSSARR